MICVHILKLICALLKREENKVHFKYIMLFYYQKGKNATQATNKICAVYEESALAEKAVRK